MKSVIETFKDIPGYKGLYQVSDFGAVRNVITGKYLKSKPENYRGYIRVQLHKNKGKERFFVHRLVYEAFVGEIPEGYEIDHINGVKDDNRLVNLRCVTSKENKHNPVTRKRQIEELKKVYSRPEWKRRHEEVLNELHLNKEWQEKRLNGTREACNKPVFQLDLTLGFPIRLWESASDAWRELGINFSHISACCRGKRKSAGGYKWMFASE